MATKTAKGAAKTRAKKSAKSVKVVVWSKFEPKLTAIHARLMEVQGRLNDAKLSEVNEKLGELLRKPPGTENVKK
jgi:hypothetical protein